MAKIEKFKLKGIPVYTSDESQEKLKEIIRKEGGSSKDLLIDLIDEKVIISVVNNPSILKLLIAKIKKEDPRPNIVGTADMKNGVVYVLFFPGLTSKMIVDTTLHEVMHLAQAQSPKQYHSINMPIYVKFYSTYYKRAFKAKSYNKEYFTKFLERLIKDDGGMYLHEYTYINLLSRAFEKHTTLSEKEFIYRLEKILHTIYNILQHKEKYNDPSIKLLSITYTNLFGVPPKYAGLGQELYSPSEIIAILSSINPSHPNIIKTLKLIKPGKKPVVSLSRVKKIIK